MYLINIRYYNYINIYIIIQSIVNNVNTLTIIEWYDSGKILLISTNFWNESIKTLFDITIQ